MRLCASHMVWVCLWRLLTSVQITAAYCDKLNSNWRVVIARLLDLQFSWRWLTVVAFAKFIHILLSRTSLTTLPTKRDYRVVWCVCGKICVSPGCSGCSGKVLGLNLHWKALSLTRSGERNGRSGIWLWRRTNIDNWIEWNWQGQWSAIRTSEGQWNKRYCWSKRCTSGYTRLWVYCPPAAAATGCWWWLVGGRFSCGVPMVAVQRTTQRLHWGCTIIIRTMQRVAIINSFGGW